MTQLNRHHASERPTSSRHPAIRRQAQRAFLASLAAGFLTTGLTGCTIMGGLQSKLTNSECIDDFMVSHRNKVMATKAWLRTEKCFKNHSRLKDLRAGFIEGYMDVANGGSGCTPTVVSSDYWGWKYQSGDGQAAVNAWFEGYPLGVKAAEEDGIGFYNQIRIQTPPQAVTAPMNGSLAPTPAVAAPTSGGNMLPPGIQLNEGETLVPGGVTYGSVEDNEGPPPEVIPLPAGPTGVGEGLEQKLPAELDDPFSQIVPVPVDRSVSQGGSGTFSDMVRDEPPEEVSLVPRTPVTSALPTTPLADVAEPTQDEIDSVIEEIFGRPDRPSAAPTPAVKSPAINESMPFLFD